MDMRYQFWRGCQVRIVSGPYRGHSGTIDSRVFHQIEGGGTISEPGYHVTLDDGQ